jgi:hypothetical protein
MKKLWMSFFALVICLSVFTVPTDPGVVSSITDVNYTKSVYFNEKFSIRATVLDTDSNILVGQVCSLDVTDISGSEKGGGEGFSLITHIETKDNCVVGIDECYFITDSGGVIWMFDNVDSRYQPGHSYKAELRCDTKSVSVVFQVGNLRELQSRAYSFLTYAVDNIVIIFMVTVIVMLILLFVLFIKGR